MSDGPTCRAAGKRRVAAWAAAVALPLAGLALPGSGAAAARPGAGEAIYRLGKLPTGAPLRATVSSDVPVEGLSAACTTCHQRSGMGSVEGRLWVPPVSGRVLFSARGSGSRLRPAYDDEALARALRDGVDVAGRPLDPLMPRYDLKPDELESLTAYLHALGAEPAPGVTATEIHFATVVTPDADPAGRRAMSDVLETFFRNKAVQVRATARFGMYHDTFRRWVLSTWELSGPPATWRAQLEERYAKEPVFAVVSGIGATEWAPVDAFCESHRVPCLLPNVDVLPDTAGKGWYTLYLSRGFALEADAIASELARDGARTLVIQVVPETGPARAGAAALRAALAGRQDVETRDLIVPAAGRGLSPALPGREAGRRRVAVFWATPPETRAALGTALAEARWDRSFVSSTALGGEPAALAASAPRNAELVHPFTRPDELGRRLANLDIWLRTRGVPPGIRRIQDQTLLACTLAGDALMHEFRDFDRDYFLELVDHVGSNQTVSAFHARLSFGPGQRLLEKGCWLVPTGGEPTAARWVTP